MNRPPLGPSGACCPTCGRTKPWASFWNGKQLCKNCAHCRRLRTAARTANRGTHVRRAGKTSKPVTSNVSGTCPAYTRARIREINSGCVRTWQPRAASRGTCDRQAGTGYQRDLAACRQLESDLRKAREGRGRRG